MKIDKAFTLVEIMVVIVIIGILAGVSLPRIFRANEPAHAGDAVQTLGLLHSAQMTYCLDHDCTSAANLYPTVCTALEITAAPNTSKFGVVTCEADGDILVTRAGDLYTIKVDKDGKFSCDVSTSDACKNIAKVIPQ